MPRNSALDEDIQPVCVPLRYTLRHELASKKLEDDHGFVGREELLADIIEVLSHTTTTRGSYLVAGYRGSGKTSLVNRALRFYAAKRKFPGWAPLQLIRKSNAGIVRRGFYALMHRFFMRKVKHSLDRTRSLKSMLSFTVFSQLAGLFRLVPGIWRKMFEARNIVEVRIALGSDRALSAEEVMYNVALSVNGAYLGNKYLSLLRNGLRFIVAAFCLKGAASVLDGVVYAGGSPGAYSVYLSLYNTASSSPGLHVAVANYILFVLAFALAGYGATAYVLSWIGIWPAAIKSRLRQLTLRVKYTREILGKVQAGPFTYARSRRQMPLDASQTEIALLRILEDMRKMPRFFGRPDVIFVFDELDKISGSGNGEETENNNCDTTSLLKAAAQRKDRVETLLSAIKNFINTGKARFFFIAGREILDSYQAERGSTSSLYESLFDKIFEVNSLLTDPSDEKKYRLSSLMETYLCRRLLPPDIATYIWMITLYAKSGAEYLQNGDGQPGDGGSKGIGVKKNSIMYSPYRLDVYYHYLLYTGVDQVEARRIILCLRNFTSFLTVHSWGNCKRMASLFEHFSKPYRVSDPRARSTLDRIVFGGPGAKHGLKGRVLSAFNRKPFSMVLQFGIIDQQRVLLAGNLSILLHHHLSRQLAHSGDKLVVSTFVTLQYILKFHRLPFSRSQLERMDEVLNIYRSPDLNNVTDTLLTKVLRLYCRRIRNSFYRYRFNSGFEQELRYISRVSDIESAAFNFSLDSNAAVKRYYRENIARVQKSRVVDGEGAIKDSNTVFADYYLALGDLYLGEQSHEFAIECYQIAVDILKPEIGHDHTVSAGKRFFQLIEALLKLGDANERRQRYERAAIAYLSAIEAVTKVNKAAGAYGVFSNEDQQHKTYGVINDVMQLQDSKWDVFRQPLWSLLYLNLKRSPTVWREQLEQLFDDIGCPSWRQKTGILSSVCFWIRETGDPQIYYRLGRISMFYEAPELAGKFLVKCLEQLDGEPGSERCAYLQGMAGTALSDAMLSKYLSDDSSKSSAPGLASLVDMLGKLVNHGETENSPTIDTMLAGIDAVSVQEIPQDTGINHILGMSLRSAQLYEQAGLYPQASFTYLNIISQLSLFTELIALIINLKDFGRDYSFLLLKDDDPAHATLEALIKWIQGSANLRAEIGWKALVNLSYTHGAAHFHFLSFHRDCDLAPLKDAGDGQDRGDSFMARCLQDFARNNERPDDLDQLPYFIRQLCEVADPDTGLYKETAFWQHSSIAQKLGFVSVWSELSVYRIRPALFKGKQKPSIEDVRIKNLSPFSVRSLVFGHWLRAVYYANDLHDKLQKWQASPRIESFYEAGAKAVYNYYRAMYYIKQISGNDQDIMFPPPGLVMFHLWKLLYSLYRYERGLSQPGREINTANIVQVVYDRLHSHVGTSVQASYLDLAFVSQRTIRYLKDIEAVEDLSSRSRHEILKTKFYLSDDYDDSRFNFEWMALHLFAPMSKLLQRYISEVMEKEEFDHRQRD
ncbi:MAG TPA: ATP-binding protein [Gammaproteobacteria bacterium]|nr:ATP-binding protein [Gammaproteobacteria bacterium]